MKKKYQNIGKIVLIVIMGIGLLYAFWNLLSSRFLLGENKKEVEMATEKILSSVKNTDRMECYTWVYRDLAEEELWDPQYDVKMVHDFEHQKFQTMKADKKEIINYAKEDIEVYSRGISPVYIPDGEGLRTALLDRWLKYEGAKTYGKQQIKGMTDFISYGYLENPDYLLSIKEEDTEDVGGVTCRKYKVRVRNTLRQEKSGEESDFEFRKAISANGLDVLELKASYPQVYRLLKESFNKDAEEFFVWVDNNDVMVQIERDYTFQYYVNVMKEHSEKIEELVGQYDYPKIVCHQQYRYSPECQTIEMPEAFEEM